MVASKKLRLSVSYAASFLTFSRPIALEGRPYLAPPALSPLISQENQLHHITDATLHHLPSFTARQMKKKSNDVGNIVVPLLPFTIALTTGIDDTGANSHLAQPLYGKRLPPEAVTVNEALQTLAISALNASSFADRFHDVDLHVSYLQSSLQHYSTMGVNGNATFTGSYYLDDPEPHQVTTILVQEWNNTKDILIDVLSPLVCSDSNTDRNSLCVLKDVTVELIDDVAVSGDITKVTLDDADTKETTGTVTAPIDNQLQKEDDLSSSNVVSYRNVADDTTHNKTTQVLTWVIPTVITSTVMLFVAFSIVYRHVQKKTNSQAMLEEPNKHQAVRCPPFHNTSSVLRQNDGHVTNKNNASTTLANQNNIDQIIQEFTNYQDEISLVSSDPSDIGNASCFSGLSGFSHLDLEKGCAKRKDHDKIENCRNGPIYLPSNLMKHESFEGKYRTISAMANVFKKDILLLAGETAETSPRRTGNKGFNSDENEIMGGLRTESLKESKESMERQRIVEHVDTDGHDAKAEIYSAGEEIELNEDL